MTPVALRARVVFPVVSPPIEEGVVTIEGERIVQVGRTAPRNVEVQDLGNVALIPGLINTHTHLEFSDLKKPLGKRGVSLPDWVRLVISRRQQRTKTSQAIAKGCVELLAQGVTTAGEISTADPSAYPCVGPTPRLVVFQEAIGFSQARANSSLNAVKNRLDVAQETLRATTGSVTHSADLRYRLGVSPHAPYSVSPPLIRELVSTASQRGLPVTMHLAESPEEIELLREGKGPFQKLLEERGMWDLWAIPRGSLAMDYIRMMTLAPRALLVHGNFLDHQALAMMGRHVVSMSLVYCPRSHGFFGYPEYPLADALSLGVRVCLGTDSRASNPDLSLLSEMREVVRRHPHVSVETVLRMGTMSGAEALGVEHAVGGIRPGLLADLTTVPLPTVQGNAYDKLTAILHDTAAPTNTWLAGQLVSSTA
ncbi:MAG: amidohydrolase family protein [Pirellulales bacterium]